MFTHQLIFLDNHLKILVLFVTKVEVPLKLVNSTNGLNYDFDFLKRLMALIGY